jgi:hypothetical protein
VLVLLGWALWRALAAARGEPDPVDGADDDGAPSLPRAALAMVAMVLVHSMLEYPLWYSYFLLPAAFAFGLCLGRPGAVATPAAEPAPATQATRPLLLASMLLMVGGAFSVQDYLRVVVIFAPPENPTPLAERIAAGQRSWFFSHHADYAAVTTAEHPSQVMPAFAGATHYLLDARLMMAWAKALEEAGDDERARHVAQRLREFRNEQAADYFAPCAEPPAPAASAPYQCLAPSRPLDERAFR